MWPLWMSGLTGLTAAAVALAVMRHRRETAGLPLQNTAPRDRAGGFRGNT